ncbi:hypothetical protein KAH55_02635 [bacterium]|nr:hypothetical protein [bacterium]
MSFSKEAFLEGEHYLNLGLTELAKDKFTQALEQNRSQNDEQGIGVCLFYLTQTAYLDKNIEEALSFLKTAQAIYQRRNHEQMLNQLDILEQGIRNLSKTEDQKTAPIPHTPLPLTIPDAQDEEKPIPLEAEIKQLRKQGNSLLLAQKLLQLAQTKLAQTDYSLATQSLHEAHEIAHQLGDKNLQSQIHQEFEDITLMRNHQDIDERSLQELVESAQSPQDKIKLALSKAEILILKNDFQGANEALHEARKRIPTESKERFIVFSMLVEFKLLLKQGLLERANTVLDYANKLATQINDSELLSLVQKLR